MAKRGRKPIPAAVRQITGSHLSDRPLPQALVTAADTIERPKRMSKTVAALWDKFIARCYWLTWADGPKALMWCCLQAEYEKAPAKMIASRIAQLRAVASEIGMDMSARTRMAIKDPAAAGRNVTAPDTHGKAQTPKQPQTDPAHKYLN